MSITNKSGIISQAFVNTMTSDQKKISKIPKKVGFNFDEDSFKKKNEDEDTNPQNV
jgi:hypothetical protein